MRTVRFVANILHQIARLAAVFYFVVAAYALIAIILNAASLPGIMEIESSRFTIFYPFSRTPFLLGDYTVSYQVMMVLFFSLYGLFLWQLGRVFHAFKQQKLFTKSSVKKLSRFYLLNFILPPLSLLLAILFYKDIAGDILVICLLHLVIGVFAWFMAAIFRQGLLLQEEQDLTF